MKPPRLVLIAALTVSLAPLALLAADETKEGGDRPKPEAAPRRDGDRPKPEADAPRRDGDRPKPEADAPRRDGDRRPMLFSEEERTKIREAREKALAEPDVKAAREKKEAADKEFFDAMKAAMLKADPSLAPLFERMDQMPGFRMLMVMPDVRREGGPRPEGARPPGTERRRPDGERPALEKDNK